MLLLCLLQQARPADGEPINHTAVLSKSRRWKETIGLVRSEALTAASRSRAPVAFRAPDRTPTCYFLPDRNHNSVARVSEGHSDSTPPCSKVAGLNLIAPAGPIRSFKNTPWRLRGVPKRCAHSLREREKGRERSRDRQEIER